jgi:hypothetical protein
MFLRANQSQKSGMQAIAGNASALLFLHFLTAVQPEFVGWGDVFFFCGDDFRFCTCNLTWSPVGAALPLPAHLVRLQLSSAP